MSYFLNILTSAWHLFSILIDRSLGDVLIILEISKFENPSELKNWSRGFKVFSIERQKSGGNLYDYIILDYILMFF